MAVQCSIVCRCVPVSRGGCYKQQKRHNMDMESFLFNFCPSLRCFSQCPEVDTDLGSERVGGKCFVLKSVRHIGIQTLPSDMTFLVLLLHYLKYYPRQEICNSGNNFYLVILALQWKINCHVSCISHILGQMC